MPNFHFDTIQPDGGSRSFLIEDLPWESVAEMCNSFKSQGVFVSQIVLADSGTVIGQA